MLYFKIAPVLFLVTLAGADKKIELQDIENDTLNNEKLKDVEKNEPLPVDFSNGINPLDFFKSKLVSAYLENAQSPPQQPRYVQQYAVTEPPEKPVEANPKANHASVQQAMVSYYSNVPMQIYLIPQYNELSEQGNHPVSYDTTGVARGYPSGVEQNYVEVPAYITSNGKGYVQQYSQPTYYAFAHPTSATNQAAVTTPIIAYQMPMVHYPTSLVAPPVVPKEYYQTQQYTLSNAIDEPQQEEPKYATQTQAQTEVPYSKPSGPEYPRYYNSRVPVREVYKNAATPELPPPNPLLLRGAPPHLSLLPKVLPTHRPLNKPVYAIGGSLISSAYNPRPTESYGLPYKRRPTSLLDSYIPSGVQIEYLKRGYAKDPLAIYEALSSGRNFPNNQIVPRQFERGFLPNQMYHTAAGGITYGHYKRSPKLEKKSSK